MITVNITLIHHMLTIYFNQGGALAITLAAENPDKVEKVVLIDAQVAADSKISLQKKSINRFLFAGIYRWERPIRHS